MSDIAAKEPINTREIKDRALHIVTQLPDDAETALAILFEVKWLIQNFYGRPPLEATATDK